MSSDLEFVPLSIPEIRGNEWQYIKECLDTGWVSSVGEFVDRFEREFATAVGAKHAVAVVNGTSALHIALMIEGVEQEDEVIVPALTFVAPVNAIRYAGAHPVFMDVANDTWQIDTAKLAAFLEEECEIRDGVLRNRASGRRIRAVLPVHILGQPADITSIVALAERYRISVIEDATEALGGYAGNRHVGTFGATGCFSFNGNKLITTGGGGMIVTNDVTRARRAKYLTTQAKDDPIEFVHGEIGYNYRLPNVLAALGVAQLEQLEDYLAKKAAIAERYRAGLAAVPGISFITEAPGTRSANWLFTIRINEAEFGIGSRQLMAVLRERQIDTRPLWCPIHLLKPYESAQTYRIEVIPRLYKECLSIPCSVGLTEAQQTRVIESIAAAQRAAVPEPSAAIA
jgi:perosamine synthetase